MANNTQTRNVSEDEIKLFHSGILGELRTLKLVEPNVTDPFDDTALVAVMEWGGPEKIGTFSSVVDALVDFKQWVQSWTGRDPSVEITTINVTIVIPTANNGSVSFGASGMVKDTDTKRAYTQLYKEVLNAVKGFQGATHSSAGPANGNGTAPSNTTEIIDVSVVKTEERNGKRYYRVGGGRWQKFGVAAWPEVWEKAGIDPALFPVGDYPFKARAVISLGADGKPEKTTEIIK